MAVQPLPVKTTIRHFMRDRLMEIDGDGFTFDVQRRVYLRDKVLPDTRVPACGIVERVGDVAQDTDAHWSWSVLTQVWYLFEYPDDGEDPDARCDLFEDDVWRALGHDHQINAFTRDTSPAAEASPGVFWFTPEKTVRNVGEAMQRRAYGWIDVRVCFKTAWYDWRRI